MFLKILQPIRKMNIIIIIINLYYIIYQLITNTKNLIFSGCSNYNQTTTALQRYNHKSYILRCSSYFSSKIDLLHYISICYMNFIVYGCSVVGVNLLYGCSYYNRHNKLKYNNLQRFFNKFLTWL